METPVGRKFFEEICNEFSKTILYNHDLDKQRALGTFSCVPEYSPSYSDTVTGSRPKPNDEIPASQFSKSLGHIMGIPIYSSHLLNRYIITYEEVERTLFERWIEPFTSYKNSVELPFEPWVKTKIVEKKVLEPTSSLAFIGNFGIVCGHDIVQCLKSLS